MWLSSFLSVRQRLNLSWKSGTPLYRRIVPAILPLLLAACSSADLAIRPDLLGDTAPVTAATRVIEVFPQTRSVNVIGGEIIRFDVGLKSFAWNFNGPVDLTSFDLQTVAPPGILDHSLMAYVQPNPLYIGGGRHGRHAGGD